MSCARFVSKNRLHLCHIYRAGIAIEHSLTGEGNVQSVVRLTQRQKTAGQRPLTRPDANGGYGRRTAIAVNGIKNQRGTESQ